MSNLICLGLLLLSQNYINNEDYASAGKITTLNLSSANYNLYYYQKLIVDFRLNKKKETIEDLVKLEDSFLPFNRRQQAMIFLIRQEIALWTDGLDDISRDMNKSRDRLKSLDPNKDTQKIQKEIVDKLSKYIDQLENPPIDLNIPSNGDLSKIKPKQGDPLSPLDESKIMGGSGKGDLNNKELKKLTEQWGSLPPMERAKVAGDLTRDVPVKYKGLWDSYIKSLNKVKP